MRIIRIGDFSRLGQVTVKTLHHYDEIGLLVPARVDPDTGYRYYVANQLLRLEQIRMLKDIDFSLEQITIILDGDLSANELREILDDKREALQSVIQVRQMQLERIEARLRVMDEGVEGNTLEPVTVKNVQSQLVLSWRGTLIDSQDVTAILRLVGDAVRAADLGLEPVRWLALYHHDGFRDTDIDLEIAVPIPTKFSGTLDIGEGRTMRVSELPPAMMACIKIHQQSLDDVRAGNQLLVQWVNDNGYELAAGFALREVYSQPPMGNGPIIFEMQYPVVRG